MTIETAAKTTLNIEFERDRAVIARIGGNEYRRRFNSRYRGLGHEVDRWVASDAESLAAGRSYWYGSYSSPFTWTDTEGDEHLTPATYTEGGHVMSPRDYRTMLPESAFDWPVYRAAVYGVPVFRGIIDEVARAADAKGAL